MNILQSSAAHAERVGAFPVRRVVLFIALLAASTACLDGPTSPSYGPAAVVALASPALTLNMQSATGIIATVKDANGEVLNGIEVRWESSAPNVLRVRSASGNHAIVEALFPGRATLTGRAGTASGSIVLDVREPGPVASISIHGYASVLSIGSTDVLDVTLRDSAGVLLSVPVQFTTSDSALLVSTPEGQVVGVGEGAAVITAQAGGITASKAYTVRAGPHALLWSAAGGLVDLGVPAGYQVSVATAVSSAGDVVGAVRDVVTGVTRGFLWTRGDGMRVLPLAPNAVSSVATGINADRTISGVVMLGTGAHRAVRWDATLAVHPLDGIEGPASSQANGINDTGQIVGWIETTVGRTPFVWSAADGVRLIDPYTVGEAMGIGAGGQVVGRLGDAAFIWTAKEGRRLLPVPLGDRGGRAYAVSSSGEAVGESLGPCFVDYDDNQDCGIARGARPILWSVTGEMLDVESAAGANANGAAMGGISSLQQVAGLSFVTGRGFVWSRAAGYVDIGVLARRSHSAALAINEAGVVVGWSSNGLAAGELYRLEDPAFANAHH